jgi:hypothetical protein
MSILLALGNLFLLPGTLMCRYFGMNPEDEMGLMRSFFNFLFWLPLGLIVIFLYV